MLVMVTGTLAHAIDSLHHVGLWWRVPSSLRGEVIVEQFTKGAVPSDNIQRKLMQLARETRTDVEGVVWWLVRSHSPDEALNKLLK